MTAGPVLTAALRAEVSALEDDLRARVTGGTREAWEADLAEARRRDRTAASWTDWSEDRVTQAAVAWVLFTVFVRFCEDNALLGPVWIGSARRLEEAVGAQEAFIRQEAGAGRDVTDREWLKQAVEYFGAHPATRDLVDARSAMWLIEPSGDAATRLLAFWRQRDDTGLVHDLTDKTYSTRFLGDLYQHLSEHAREHYALLQTPEFVEEFILDQTLEPALQERKLDGFRLIDPTCGSGHFLLGAFSRLLDRWRRQAPGIATERERVQLALDALHGVDLNPFAVAITRFRLTVAALVEAGDKWLEHAPDYPYHLATGDSLLFGLGQRRLGEDELHDFAYSFEDVELLERMLTTTYDVVVGNPPYITARDRTLNRVYRDRFNYCKGKYALTVPFMERFFTLANPGEPAGWVGQITSNSFMKREFGVPLIERFLAKQDLRLVADTSGAYIPGHGTPTVIIVGRPQRSQAPVRAVLGIRGEPGRPDDAAHGEVWSSIVTHLDQPGWTDDWISVISMDQAALHGHPWSLTGGGAIQLLENLQAKCARPLKNSAKEIGVVAVIGEEEAFALPPHSDEPSHPVVAGEDVRDFYLGSTPRFWPYDDTLSITDNALASRHMWPFRTSVSAYLMFGKTRRERGLAWLAYGMLAKPKLATALSIAFAEVATHNHFVLDRGGRVFKQTAPVIKLPEGASEDDHLALLGVLNSSAASFWLKQNSHEKGGSGLGRGVQDEAWESRYQFTATTLQDFPFPAELPLERGRGLDALAQQAADHLPGAVCGRGTTTREDLNTARVEHEQLRAQMIARQEELDWDVYRSYGLVDDDLTYDKDDLPSLALGERAFEIVLARRIAAGQEESSWFDRHRSTPITEPPAHWPAAYRDLVERRVGLAESHPYLKLLEKPEHKRRWAAEPWEKQEEQAVRDWLLDRLEDKRFWFDRQGRPLPRSIAQVADDVSRDSELTGVLALWEGRPDVPVATSLQRLTKDQAVPFLAAYRYKDSGLRKRAAWEHTWALQRREDAGETLPAPIPVPPKYTSADFTRTGYWSNRGKLDVPKERFVLYPDAGRDTDPTPVLGWAGWDHAQQALALALLAQQRRAEGWEDARLIPLVAGLAELQPWLEQWHADPDPAYGGASPAEFFAEQLAEHTGQLATTVAALGEWRPQRTRSGRRPARP